MKKKTCCEHFDEYVTDGFVVREPEPVRHFALLQLHARPGLGVSIRLFYCPLCGKKLDEGK